MNRINGKMRGNDPTGYLQKSSRRRILSLSAGALATGVAGCSALNLGESSGLSSPDQTALEEYSDSYETVQEAKEKYENGIETFRENTGPDGTIEGQYPADWPELQEQMRTSEGEFSNASGGFKQARRSASSSTIESGCDIAVEWVEPHIEVAEIFRDVGGASEGFVDRFEERISNLPAPLDPETLRERAVNGESLNATPAGTQTPTPTSTPTDVSSSKHQFKSPPYENVERQEGQSTTTISGEIVLESGEYAQQEIRVEQSAQFSITGVNEGEGDMDVFLLTPESAFAKYQEAESAVFSGGLVSTEITDIERTVEISGGSHFLVFDNTAVYGAEPQGTVRFEFEVKVHTGTSTSPETEEEDRTEQEETEEPTETEPPSQPKIREVTDNFGHTFTFSRDTSDSVRVDDEVVVSDDTAVELCVTEVAKQSDDDVTYSYDFLDDASHPDNPDRATDRIENNCWSWDMRRADYQADWGFRIWVRNEDEIYYHNNSVESDYVADVYYTNLTLEGE